MVLDGRSHRAGEDPPGDSAREEAFERRATWLRGLTGTMNEQRTQMITDWSNLGVVGVRDYTVGDGKFPERIQVESRPGSPLDQAPDTANLVNLHAPEAGPPTLAAAAGGVRPEDGTALVADEAAYVARAVSDAARATGYGDRLPRGGDRRRVPGMTRPFPRGAVRSVPAAVPVRGPAPAPAFDPAFGTVPFDVVVAGGGPAGCAAALTLVRAGRRVLPADAGTGPPKAGETLVPAGRVVLGDLAVTDRVLGPGHLHCYGTLSAWGSSGAHDGLSRGGRGGAAGGRGRRRGRSTGSGP